MSAQKRETLHGDEDDSPKETTKVQESPKAKLGSKRPVQDDDGGINPLLIVVIIAFAVILGYIAYTQFGPNSGKVKTKEEKLREMVCYFLSVRCLWC